MSTLSQTDIAPEQREALVKNAVKVIRDAFQKQHFPQHMGRAQLSNLVGICRSATCSEEIELYARYQAGREIWDEAFANALVEGVKSALENDYGPNGLRAWRLYSVFAAREYTYQFMRNKKGGR